MSTDRKAYMRAYYQKHAEAIKAKVAAWAKANPERARANARSRSAAYQRRNAAAVRLKQLAWRAENPDWQRAWNAANPDRLRAYKLKRRAAGNVSAKSVRAILETCNGICEYCLRAPATSVDHVIPVKRGGLSVPENLVGACMTCNRAKSYKTPLEWLGGLRALESEP